MIFVTLERSCFTTCSCCGSGGFKSRDEDGVLYVRKTLTGCGFALNPNGQLEVQNLFPHLQKIVKKYPDNFDGTSVTDSIKMDDIFTESKDEKEADGEDRNN